MSKLLTKDKIEKWTKALRSGKYKQTTGSLQVDDKYCCLGVACDIFIPKDKLVKNADKEMFGWLPVAQPASPAWLKTIASRFELDTGATFVLLNDRQEFTFDEIADVLEAVYILEVLK